MKSRLYAAIIPLLLTSTAVVAQDSGGAMGYGVTGGLGVLVLPDVSTGVGFTGSGPTGASPDNTAIGGTFGLSGVVGIGKIGDFDAAIGVSGFLTVARSSGSVVETFSGPGTVFVGGYTPPAGANAVLTINQGVGQMGADVAVSDTNPQGDTATANINSSGLTSAVTDAYLFTPTADSFAFGGYAIDGAAERALAFGAVAATDGNGFGAQGDLTGLTVTTTTSNNVVYTGADLTLALSGAPSAGVVLQAYVGPSVRYLGQTFDTDIVVNIPEAGAGPEFPLYTLSRDETVNGLFLGGVVGLQGTTQLSDTTNFTLGAEAGIYHVHSTLSGSETASVSGGSPTAVSQSVVNGNTASATDDRMAYALRGTASTTMSIAPQQQIVVSGMADYLSSVPTIARPTGGGMPTIDYGSMFALTGTISLTGQF